MKRILVTGGSGFIGTNFCLFSKKNGLSVLALDNLSGQGSKKNLKILEDAGIEFSKADITKPLVLKSAKFDVIVHLAAAASSPRGLKNPQETYLTNVAGTLNVLEFARKTNTPLIFTSTIKVYDPAKVNKFVMLDKLRYKFSKTGAVDEGFPTIDFKKPQHPLGVSKHIAEILVGQYSRRLNLPTIVLRLSTVFGLYQHGSEELGWVYWFIKAKKEDKPITIYGTGKQVRDCLWVDDLSLLLLKLLTNIENHKGKTYNVGGGDKNSLSLLELIHYLENKDRKKMKVHFKPARADDFKIYITDNSEIKKDFSWEPKTSVFEGIDLLYNFDRL